jgi:hypothetical protein
VARAEAVSRRHARASLHLKSILCKIQVQNQTQSGNLGAAEQSSWNASLTVDQLAGAFAGQPA